MTSADDVLLGSMSQRFRAQRSSSQPIMRAVIPGQPVTGNHYKKPRPYGRGHYVSAEAKLYAQRIATIALANRRCSQIPAYVRIELTYWNCRCDWDNGAKVICDALQGIVFEHDSRILKADVEKRKDNDGPRVEVAIFAVNAKAFGY